MISLFMFEDEKTRPAEVLCVERRGEASIYFALSTLCETETAKRQDKPDAHQFSKIEK